MKGTKRRLTKLQNHNLKQRFKSDFSTGLYSIVQLADTYNVGRQKLLKWKKEIFGKGSIQQKRIFQMHLAGMPSKAIAEFFGVHIFQVHRAIRQERAKYAKQPQTKLFNNHKPKTEMNRTNKPQEKKQAKALYLKGTLDQKEIAEMVGVTEATLTRWAKEWKNEKAKLLDAVNNCFNRLNEKLKDPKADPNEIKILVETLEKLENRLN